MLKFLGLESKEKEKNIENIVNMGFTKDQAAYALQKCDNDPGVAVHYLLQQQAAKPQQQQQQYRQQPNANQQNIYPSAMPSKITQSEFLEQAEIQKAMEMSLQQKPTMQKAVKQTESQFQVALANNFLNNELIKFEPLNPDERQRQGSYPAGMKNIGNTCYFNSLIQAYFYIPEFTQKILQNSALAQNQVASSHAERERACNFLVANLGGLFSKMVLTNRKYTEPSDVLRALVDDFGEPILFGEQKDIAEFNLNFLERVEEGLGERQSSKLQINGVSKQALDDTISTTGSESFSHPQQINMIRKSSIMDDTEYAKVEDVRINQLSESMRQQNTIQGLFFGKITQILKITSQGKQKIFNEKTEKMGPVMLDIASHSSLYDAWNATCVEEIEDFNYTEVAQSFFDDSATGQAPNGTKCIKETWLKELPKVLFFTLNRVMYDRKQQKLIKNLKSFQFDKEIYADKFMLENKSKDSSINDQVELLREQQKQIRDKLSSYKEYHKGMSIIEIMSVTRNFIESQCEDFVDIDNDGENNLSKHEPRSPSKIGKFGKKPEEIEDAVRIIQSYSDEIVRQISILEQKLIDIEQEINTAYGTMKKNLFNLHAILIHEGNAELGHYYAFIFDRKEKQWYRFNDYKVTKEDEVKVFDESFGGKGLKSCAYGLLYIHQETANLMEEQTFSEYNQNLQQFIPNNFVKVIKGENYVFNDQLTQYQVEKIVKSVYEKFKTRSDKVQYYVNQNNLPLYADQINFNIYLIKKYNKPSLAKWQLLNQCLKEEHPSQLGLLSVAKDDLVYSRLRPLFSAQALSIDSESVATLQKIGEIFKIYERKLAIIQYILLNLNEKSWYQAIKAITYYRKLVLSGVNQHQELDLIVVDVNRAFVLYCTTMVNKNFAINQSEKAVNFAMMAAYDTLQLIDENDLHYKQVSQNLEQSLQQGRKCMSEQQLSKVTALVQQLKTKDLSLIEPLYNANDQVSQRLQTDMQKIDDQDLDKFSEGWTNESPASNYYALLQLFKAKYNVNIFILLIIVEIQPWIKQHAAIVQEKRTIPPQEILKFEIEMGIQMPVLTNNMI